MRKYSVLKVKSQLRKPKVVKFVDLKSYKPNYALNVKFVDLKSYKPNYALNDKHKLFYKTEQTFKFLFYLI